MSTIKIVHASDLHFDTKDSVTIWGELRNFLNHDVRPHLVLITGDIVDSPDQQLVTLAFDQLSTLIVRRPNPADAYRVCAGNHDRHFHGTAQGFLSGVLKAFQSPAKASAWFGETFAGRMSTVGVPEPIELEEGRNRWKVHLMGVDTSINAVHLAQGFAVPTDLQSLTGAASRVPPRTDLVILMHHHHLLPIKELEDERQALSGVFNSTIMLNAGTVLHTLARANINLVLHGHEHHRMLARYGAVDEQQSEIVVLGAGSATGNKTLDGCRRSRASLNLIELRPDRSVYVREIGCPNSLWQILPGETLLLDGRAIRRARFNRRRKGETSPPTSRIVKSIEFHPDRNVTITQSWSNWTVDPERWTHITKNSSGTPLAAIVDFHWSEQGPPERRVAEISPDKREAQAYGLEVVSPGRSQSLAQRIRLTLGWRGAAVLTQDDLDYLSHTTPGDHRKDGREFAGVLATGELESLSLMVRLPARFAPARHEITAWVRESSTSVPEEVVELTQSIQEHAPGVFGLEVPYPLPDYRYELAWPVKTASRASEAAAAFAACARVPGNGVRLLEEFQYALKRVIKDARSQLALYVPAVNDPKALVKVAQLSWGTTSTSAQLPERLAFGGANSVTHLARWGQIVFGTRVAEEDKSGGGIDGFLPGERSLALVPIKQSNYDDDLAWGVVRLGVDSELEFGKEILDIFADGIVMVLQTAIRLKETVS
jgi:Calcineurin-like phosphoesterase